MNLIRLHRISYYLHTKKIPVFPRILQYLIFLIYNSNIPASVKIGKGSIFGHGGIGVVIHERTIIGDNCTICQGITIGGRSKKYNVPVIGNRVYIGAGARILGDIAIGNNIIIGPNAVVISDIPDNCAVGGVPAKIIRRNIKYNELI